MVIINSEIEKKDKLLKAYINNKIKRQWLFGVFSSFSTVISSLKSKEMVQLL